MDNVIQTNQVKKRVENLKAQQEEQLEMRRQKLAALLLAEKEQYEYELTLREETPEQRREKMQQRAQELKRRREEQRRQIVDEKLYQQWRESIDDLRKQDSKLFLVQCQAERDAQVQEKQEISQQDMQDDAVFAELWRLDQEKKAIREQEEKLKKSFLNKETKQTLDWQMKELHARAEAVEKLRQEEIQRLKDQWERDREEQEKAERDRILSQNQRRTEIEGFNMLTRAQKDALSRREKDLDKVLLQTALQKEKQEETAEQAEKNRLREEAQMYRKHLLEQMQREAQDESALERLRFDEQEKVHSKRQATWDRERAAREELMRDVTLDRENAMRRKQEMAVQSRHDKLHEKAALELTVEQLRALEQEKEEAERQSRTQYRDGLMEQIGDLDARKRRQAQEKLYEDRAAQLAEMKYQKRLKEEYDRQSEKLAALRQLLNQNGARNV
eukprot:GILK01001306.1.p1 GENE.GILK01001306.1~~GILK01001306.1.p1  ORF type:complete len:510 (+),score=133.93 GILK01001306.1:196-1530(+)